MSRDVQVARQLREIFTDRPAERQQTVPWEWPREMQEAGIGQAVMYSSDKWRRRGDFEDYKHVAEGPQKVWVRPGFIVDHGTRRPLELYGPMVRLPKMPASFAVLANLTGVQLQFYEGDDEEYWIPNGDDNCWQVDCAHAKIGGARFPSNKKAFLVIYTKSSVDMIIVGDQLDILKDGIVG